MKKLNLHFILLMLTFLNVIKAQEVNRDIINLEKINNEAGSLWENGKYDKAAPLYEKALIMCQKNLGENNPDTARAFNNLAATYETMGKYDKAYPLFEKALCIREKTLGPEDPKTIATLNDIGTLWEDFGNYSKAVSYKEKAFIACKKTLGQNDPDIPAMLNNLAGPYIYMGNYKKALPLEEQALILQKKELGYEHQSTANTINNIAYIYTLLGDCKNAIPLYEKALSIYKKHFGTEHPDIARLMNNMTPAYEGVGDYYKSLKTLEEALKIQEKTLGPQHPEISHTLNNIAKNKLREGDYINALSFYNRSKTICEKSLGVDHPDTISSYFSISKIKYIQNTDLATMREMLAKVFQGREKLLNAILIMDEPTRLSWQKDNLQYDMIDQLDAEQIVAFIIRTKGIVIDSLLEDTKAIKKIGSDTQEMREISSARLQIGKLAFSRDDRDKKEVTRLQERINSIIRKSANSKNGDGFARSSLLIKKNIITSALPDSGCIVDFIQFGDPKFNADAGRRYGALILGCNGESTLVRINDATQIDASIRSLREAISNGDETAILDLHKLLSEKLWAPIAANLPIGTKKLFIGADGQLNFLSFAVLPTNDGSFLAEHYDIAYVGSARDLARKVTPSDSKSIALFADPVFDQQSSTFSSNALALRSAEVDELGKIILPPLPGTRTEASVVEAVAKSGGWTFEAHLGTEASKPAIEILKSPGILHLATHGFYLNTLPQGADGKRGLKVVESPEMIGNKPLLPKIDPMHASGIALTGAQATLKAWSEGRVPDAKEDGILTAEEVGALNLEGTWLVTLSACETGVGEARSGEGVFGLRRAFMMAGAQNLLMTLWPVSDEVTPKIMADFYKEALATHDAAGSLAKVQRDWLLKLRKEKGLLAAVRDAGPFAMVVMANPNAKTLPSESPAKAISQQQEPSMGFSDASNATGSPPSAESSTSSGSPEIPDFHDALTKANTGDGRAQAIVSIYYSLGYKAEKDLSKAAEYASKSAAQNNPLGQYQLGVLTAGGEGVQKDLEKGKSLKVESIEGLNTMSDDPYALAALGAMALRGEGVAKDMKKAAKLYKQSADLGYAPAQVLYAMMLTKGVGVASSPDAARKYARMAEEQNYHP